MGLYAGDPKTGGAGAAALDAQLFITEAGLSAGRPSEATVDDDGVLERFVMNDLAGMGLSIIGILDDRAAGAGNRVGSPDSMLKVFGLGDPELSALDG